MTVIRMSEATVKASLGAKISPSAALLAFLTIA